MAHAQLHVAEARREAADAIRVVQARERPHVELVDHHAVERRRDERVRAPRVGCRIGDGGVAVAARRIVHAPAQVDVPLVGGREVVLVLLPRRGAVDAGDKVRPHAQHRVARAPAVELAAHVRRGLGRRPHLEHDAVPDRRCAQRRVRQRGEVHREARVRRRRARVAARAPERARAAVGQLEVVLHLRGRRGGQRRLPHVVRPALAHAHRGHPRPRSVGEAHAHARQVVRHRHDSHRERVVVDRAQRPAVLPLHVADVRAVDRPVGCGSVCRRGEKHGEQAGRKVAAHAIS